MSVIHIPKRAELGFRQLLLPATVFLALLIVFCRLWYLQVVKSAELAERAVSFGFDSIPTLAPRGLIVDRNGTLLAGVRPELVVTLVPDALKKSPWVLQKVADMVGVPVEKLQRKLDMDKKKQFLPRPIFAGVTIETATRIAESADELPGVDVQTQPIRYYPDDTDFAHVLGYVWTPSENDIERLTKENVRPSYYVGKIGLEAAYEKELMGTPGTDQIEFDARRRPVWAGKKDDPIPGERLKLSLDSNLQKLAMDELRKFQADSPDSGGAVVALDPRTGDVLCLASNPTYSANEFLEGIKGADYQDLNNNPLKPLLNRAIDGAYPPGSTFKIVTSLAAARAGTFNANRTVFCNGYYLVGNRHARCLGHHGAISYENALIRSCNTYFSDLAVRTGPEELKNEGTDLGLGLRSGIDLPGERRGIFPTDAWWKKNKDRPWYPGDTVNIGIGQGDVAATPIQMADLAALVANEGVCYRPHLVKAFYQANSQKPVKTVEPEALYKTDVPSNVWQDLKSAMVGVIERGTARRAQIPGIVWGGKTGSAEHGGAGRKTHAWFVGFAPADNPRIAIAAVVERSGHGGEVAAPIAAAVVKRYLEEVGVLSSSATVASNVREASSAHAASLTSFRRR